MSSNDSLPEALLDQYLTGSIREEDRQRLMDWFEAFDDQRVIVAASSEHEEAQVADRLWNGIVAKTGLRPAGRTFRLYRYGWVAAACMVVLILGGVFLWKKLEPGTGAPMPAGHSLAIGASAVQPGRNGAILTLSDGSKVALDGQRQEEIEPQGQAKVMIKGDKVVYVPATRRDPKAAVAYNTMTTPRGRQFSLVLPDGTKVWLNASSSITYPVSFDQTGRRVSIVGEVYFEVAHLKDPVSNTKVPFEVKAGSMQIKVLGTHFDVSNYPDEPAVKTSLLEGSVLISLEHQNRSVQISPGQQAALLRSGADDIKVSQVNMEHVMAWKSGLFRFDNDQLEDILRQVSRWYNVDVDCAVDKQHLRFNGVISKRSDVQDLLNLLSATGVVAFKIKGDHIYAY